MGSAKTCAACGQAPPAPGRRICRACISRHELERQAGRKAAGTCVRCGRAPARPGRTLCGECAEKKSAEQRDRYRRTVMKRRAALIASGLCPECGNDPGPGGYRLCPECRERSRMRMQAYRAGTGGPCDGDCLSCKYDDCIIDVTPADRAREQDWERRKRKRGEH